MPQYRRKVAFSHKQKKAQLQARRNKKRVQEIEEENLQSGSESAYNSSSQYDTRQLDVVTEVLSSSHALPDRSSVYQQDVEVTAGPSTSSGRNRYQLKFKKSSKHEKEKRQLKHYEPIISVPEETLETTSGMFYPSGLDYPKRPKWTDSMSKKELDHSENRHFRLFCESIDSKFTNSEISRYELNLETWRQLWRVTEMSDILLVIVDVRYAALQFPPYLYQDLIENKKKDLILVLNKCDLVMPSLVLAWKRYFQQQYPKLKIVPFYSLEGCKTPRSLLKRACQSSLRLIDACQQLVQDEIDISNWRTKIREDSDVTASSADEKVIVRNDTNEEVYTRLQGGVLTLGTIGHPNVGKSSLINALMGKKVVSVSKTPGHTKHFQTIFLTKTVKLCDCPGLVFPSICPMELQVLSGSYPIAQYFDPVGVVNYIATHLDLPQILNLPPPQDFDPHQDLKWTAFTLAESWAIKRKYFTKKGKADVPRAANELLRLTLSGMKNLVLSLKPQDYSKNKEDLEGDAELSDIIIHKVVEEDAQVSDESSEDSDRTSEEEEELLEGLADNKFALLVDDED